MRALVAILALGLLCGCAAGVDVPAGDTSAGDRADAADATAGAGASATDEIGDDMRSIAAIGDSITEAVGFNGVTPTDQWLYLLLGRLGETDIEFGAEVPSAAWADSDDVLVGREWVAYNLGVSGQTTAQMLARFDRDVPADADVIIIAGGLNDVFVGVSAEDVVANVQAMVEKARTITERVIVCALPPCTGDTEAVEDEIVALNDAYREVCEDADASYVDWYAALLASDGSRDSAYSDPDGVHPNAEGNMRLAEAFDVVADFGW